jgi:hypothetical protein
MATKIRGALPQGEDPERSSRYYAEHEVNQPRNKKPDDDNKVLLT